MAKMSKIYTRIGDDKKVVYKNGKAKGIIEEVLHEEPAKAEKGSMVAFLAFTVFLLGSVSSVVCGAMVRSVALRVNPLVAGTDWLSAEIQAAMVWAAIWAILMQVCVIIVHARIGRLIAK